MSPEEMYKKVLRLVVRESERVGRVDWARNIEEMDRALDRPDPELEEALKALLWRR